MKNLFSAMSYYEKFEIKFMNMIVDETVELGEIVEEDGTTYAAVYDRDKVGSFQQIREYLSLFGVRSENSRLKLTEKA